MTAGPPRGARNGAGGASDVPDPGVADVVIVSSVARGAVDEFLGAYWRRHPVTATFAGATGHDGELPDWSPAGQERAVGEIADARAANVAPLLDARRLWPHTPWPASAPLVDLELADAALEIEAAERLGTLMHRGNPSLAVGEAVFGIVSLMQRDAAPIEERWALAATRLAAFEAYFAGARATLTGRVPEAFVERAHRELEGATILLRDGLPLWLDERTTKGAEAVRAAAPGAIASVAAFADWLKDGVRVDNGNRAAAGDDRLAQLYVRGHWSPRLPTDWLVEVRERFAEARSRLATMAGAIAPGGWAEVQSRLAADHLTGDSYLGAFERCWNDCRELCEREQVVDWPEAPLRFVSQPSWTREAAPYLYYLPYRSPALLTPWREHVHEIAPADASVTEATREARLRSMTVSQVKLNHVVHHASIGHHVQNWHAARSPSRVGQVAAVDGASRIALFAGGSLAEGWACYATDLMDELGFCTPEERVAEQHTRVRLLARMIADIELHRGSWTLAQGVRFYGEQVGMSPEMARGETVKNLMFPGTASMYWLGLDGLHALRVSQARSLGASFSRHDFHQQVLAHGAIPVPMIAQLISAGAPP